MTMISDPWAILELEPGADTAAIRRAYAKKLKTVRPDEDPTEFQTLVEARDRALVHFERTRSQFEPQEIITSDQQSDATEIRAGTPTVYQATSEALSHQHDKTTVSIGAEGAGYNDTAEPIDFAALTARLEKLHQMSNVYVDLDGWNSFLLQIGGLPMRMRELLEPTIIESFCNITQYCERTSLFPHVPVSSRDRELILAYDEEFGWSANDRNVYTAIGRERADGFKWRLSQIWAEQRPQHELGRRGLARRAEQAAAIRRASPPRREINLRPLLPLAALLLMYLIRKFG